MYDDEVMIGSLLWQYGAYGYHGGPGEARSFEYD